jgi:PDZ domain-containing protein
MLAGKVLGGALVLLVVAAAALWIAPSGDYILLPSKAEPVAPLVKFKGAKDPSDGGGIYYDAVTVRKARLFEQLFPWIHEGATLVPADQVNPPGVGEGERHKEDLREMARSQDIAAAVALRQLGYKVTLRSSGALIQDVLAGSPAAKAGLKPTEVIVAVDRKPVRKTSDLRPLIVAHPPGSTLLVTLRSASGLRQVRVRTVADTQRKGRPVIGVIVLQATQIKLPFPVRIDTGSIGGPSAGLAFALDVYEELGHDIDHGYKVAATGQLEPDGTVSPIGGAMQKSIGVRRAKVDIFVVPAGDNAADARKYATGVRVIPVETFRQALQALATLPPKQ